MCIRDRDAAVKNADGVELGVCAITMSMARMPAGAHGAIWQFPHAALNWANGKRRVTCAKGLKEEYLMDLEKLIENAKVCLSLIHI